MVVTVLLVVVWIGSGWFWLAYITNDLLAVVSVHNGCLYIQHLDGPLPGATRGWHLAHSQGTWRWLGDFWSTGLDWRYVVPLWTLFVPTLLIALLAWRRDILTWRRAHPHVCPKCHYDRTGLAANAVCPECGASATDPVL